eukprot:c31101_g1_i1.p2 GENE.c31101_g1_i1~~c31101_g1_i1.p2  ORF type:complete len:104 (+),score=6.98 c31101_g1_i1:3-314(+)
MTGDTHLTMVSAIVLFVGSGLQFFSAVGMITSWLYGRCGGEAVRYDNKYQAIVVSADRRQGSLGCPQYGYVQQNVKEACPSAPQDAVNPQQQNTYQQHDSAIQ